MFKITKNEEAFNKFSWILRAVSKDKIKPIFCGLCVEAQKDKTTIVASDSHRLHMATIDKIDLLDGTYEIVKATKSEIVLGDLIDGQFPNYKQVLFKTSNESFKITFNELCGGAQAMYTLARRGVCIHPNYVKDAIIDNMNCVAAIKADIPNEKCDSISPVMFSGDLGVAVVMPIQMKKEEQ
jgi:DNA polymerase III sliding clamp (beta) subunit (PCNA family)